MQQVQLIAVVQQLVNFSIQRSLLLTLSGLAVWFISLAQRFPDGISFTIIIIRPLVFFLLLALFRAPTITALRSMRVIMVEPIPVLAQYRSSFLPHWPIGPKQVQFIEQMVLNILPIRLYMMLDRIPTPSLLPLVDSCGVVPIRPFPLVIISCWLEPARAKPQSLWQAMDQLSPMEQSAWLVVQPPVVLRSYSRVKVPLRLSQAVRQMVGASPTSTMYQLQLPATSSMQAPTV